jgi:hypothetical protein
MTMWDNCDTNYSPSNQDEKIYEQNNNKQFQWWSFCRQACELIQFGLLRYDNVLSN